MYVTCPGFYRGLNSGPFEMGSPSMFGSLLESSAVNSRFSLGGQRLVRNFFRSSLNRLVLKGHGQCNRNRLWAAVQVPGDL